VEPHWLQILTLASALLAAGIATGLGGSIFIESEARWDELVPAYQALAADVS
jgi:hypothetical protein